MFQVYFDPPPSPRPSSNLPNGQKQKIRLRSCFAVMRARVARPRARGRAAFHVYSSLNLTCPYARARPHIIIVD